MLISNVVKRPIVTEKSLSFGASENKYFFEVDMKASKGSVAKEVARIYGVDVQNVSTMIMPGKKRRVPKTNKFMKTKKWKKALVKLKDGQSIDITGGK